MSVTVQVALPAALNAAGEHTNDPRELGAGADRPTCVDRVTPFRTAVIVAVCAEGILPAVTVKVPLPAPAPMPTLPGTVSTALSSLREIETALAAALFSEAVHVALCPLFRLAGEQLSDVKAAGAVKVKVVLCVPPFKLALTVAISSAGIAVTVVVNCALVCPATMVTDPGVVTLALLSAMATSVFAAAGAVRDAVQVVPAGDVNVLGEHASELSTLGAGATRLTDVDRVTPFNTAVIVAVWFDAMEPAVTLKGVLLAPAPTVTFAGAGRLALLLDVETVTAPAVALLKKMVQIDVCPLLRLAGEQLMADSAAGAASVMLAVRVTDAAVAVTIAAVSAATCPPVAVKPAVVCPALTVTLAGTVRLP